MSADDTTLADFQETSFDYTPLTFARSAAPDAVIADELAAWKLDPDWLGKQPGEVPGDVSFHRFQFDRQFDYVVAQDDDDSKIAVVELRTYVNWVGDPPQALKDRIRETDNPRLATLFDTGPYEGWLTGFNFFEHGGFTEDSEVAARDVNNLGIPQFEVLVMDEGGRRVGHAGGFFDPFVLLDRPPQHERWRVTKNPARESYELRPQAGSRQRLLGKRKQVTLDGEYIGNTVPTRGTVWLKMAYGTSDGTYKDSHSGRQMWSRRKLVQENPRTTGAGIAAGRPVWKTYENESTIALVSTKPDGFEPVQSEAVDPGEATELALDDVETTFNVRHDTGDLLGKYTPPVTRDISEERGTDFYGTVPR